MKTLENLEQVAAFLVVGANPDAHNQDGGTPALAAVESGSVRILDLLLDAGINVDEANYDGVFPLWLGAYIGLANVVKMLLANGAHPDLTCPVHGSALFAAAAAGHAAVVKLLLYPCGAVLDTYYLEMTALWAAAKSRHHEVARLLLEAGADPNLSDKNYNVTPICIACTWGRTSVVDMLTAVGGVTLPSLSEVASLTRRLIDSGCYSHKDQ